MDVNGRAFWKLKGYAGEQEILLQGSLVPFFRETLSSESGSYKKVMVASVMGQSQLYTDKYLEPSETMYHNIYVQPIV